MIEDNMRVVEPRAGVEWPTIALIGLVYSAWLGLTWFHDAIALPLWLIAAALSGTLWGSLQHEIMHGHPTRSRALNEGLATPPLWLWLPYERYRQTHLCHHRDERLTDPLDDPESRYWRHEDWQKLSGFERCLVNAQSTLAGRLLIGPVWSIAMFWHDEARAIFAGDHKRLRIWLWHGLWVALALWWIIAICGLPMWQYALGFVLAPTAITFIRSFAEHRASDEIEKRTAIIENSWILGPLFLFNNLHFVHHSHPGLPWYRLPAVYQRHREDFLRANDGLVYQGYGEIFRRYLVRAHDSACHPTGRALFRNGALPPNPRDPTNDIVADDGARTFVHRAI